MAELLAKQARTKAHRESFDANLEELGHDEMAKFMENHGRAEHDYERQQPGGNEIDH
jgi:cephalosporin hydroxylase